MAYFENTTIPNNVLNAMRAEDPGKYDRILAQLSNAITNQDSRDANDAIMKIAYFSKQKPGSEEYGVGPGNANVSKIHSGHWRVNAGIIDNYMPWAAEHVNSSDSVYKQWNGDTITYDDLKGAAINGKIVDWGQRAHTEGGGKMDVPNPYIGEDAAPPTNPTFTGGATNTDLGAIWPNVDWTTQGRPGAEGLEQYPYWQSIDNGGPTELPPQKQMDLSAYRTGSRDYWNKYIPQESRGLLEMTRQLQPEYSLAYQPGEFRDPTSWAAGSGGPGKPGGFIPEGAWRRATVKPSAYMPKPALPGTVSPNLWARDTTGKYTNINAPGWGTWGTAAGTNPWDFTSPAMGTNVAWQPWSAEQLNLNPQTSKNWQGLLADIDTSPTITPGLLTTGKGGPITFGT
jgi:hypothetical protein